MASPWKNDIGAYLKVSASAGGRLVAAGTGDAAEVTGIGVDTLGYGSAKLVIAAQAVNTATKKLQLSSVKISYSADNSSWDSDTEQLSANVDVVTGTGAQVGSYTLDIDLTGQKRYVRVKYTPDHTASGTDTAEVTAVFVLGGASTVPAA